MGARDPTWGTQATAFVVELATGKHQKQVYPWATIVGYLWGITKHYEEEGMPSPCEGILELGHVLQGVHKLERHHVKRMEGVTLNMLVLMAQACSATDVEAVRNNLYYQMHFGTWCRSASSLPKTVAKYDSGEHLAWRDVLLLHEGKQQYLAVGVKSQKPDVYGMRLDETGHCWYALSASPGQQVNVCCTYALYAAAAKAQDPAAPFFQQVEHNELTGRPATYKQMLAAFKKDLKAVCPDKEMENFGLHSFRRGGATTAKARGIPDTFIQQFGCWSSEAYKLYTEMSVQDMLAISQVIFSGQQQ